MKNNIKIIGILLVIAVIGAFIAGCTNTQPELKGVPPTCKFDRIETTTITVVNNTLEQTGKIVHCSNNDSYAEVTIDKNPYWVQVEKTSI